VPGPDDGPDVRLAEDQLGPLVGVLGVHRHVGGSGGQHGEDGDVQLVGARGHPYADPVPESHPGVAQPPPQRLHLDGQVAVREAAAAVVERGLVGTGPHGGVEDVDEGAR
jgi:hypothetical protein